MERKVTWENIKAPDTLSGDALLKVPVQVSFQDSSPCHHLPTNAWETPRQTSRRTIQLSPVNSEICEIINGGFERLSFGVACYITIDKTSFLNYPWHSSSTSLSHSHSLETPAAITRTQNGRTEGRGKEIKFTGDPLPPPSSTDKQHHIASISEVHTFQPDDGF